MKIIFVLMLASLMSGCVANRFSVLQDLRESGCELRTLELTEERASIECFQFNDSLYNVEMMRRDEQPGAVDEYIHYEDEPILYEDEPILYEEDSYLQGHSI